jgi:hypothetical protein
MGHWVATDYVGNFEPIPTEADADPDQKVEEGETVTLDGSNSTDSDGFIASYLWTQTAGTPVTLSDTTAADPTFVSPPVVGNGTTLIFQLTVTDNEGLQANDEVTVTINDNGITGFPDDVLTFTSSSDSDIGIKEESGGNCTSLITIDPSTISDTTNRPNDLIYGLIDMQIKVDTAGGAAVVTFYLSIPAPAGYKWYKYSPSTGWFDYSAYADFNDSRDEVTLTLIDGGIGDHDGTANGIIMDPSGLGTAPVTPEPTPAPSGGGGRGCFIATAAFGSLMESHVKLLRKFRDRILLANSAGKGFVRLYYTFSPGVADFIANHDTLRAKVRWSLLPLVGVSWMTLQLGPGVTPTLMVMLFALMAASAVTTFKRMRLRRQA